MSSESKIDFLFLNETQLVEAGALDMPQCINIINETFRLVGIGDYIMGGSEGSDHGLALRFPKEPKFPGMPCDGPDRRFMSLISYLGGDFNVCGEKWYGSNIENRERGLPRSVLTVTLNDPVTGAPFALMSGNLISAMRTGAVPGVACRHLAPRNAKVVGAVGGGVINKTCLRAIVSECAGLERVDLYDVDLAKGKMIAQELTEELGISVVPVASLRECVEGSDILTVAASGRNLPEIDEGWIKPGSLVTLTGNAKFTGNFYRKTRIVADMWAMHRNWIVEDRKHLSETVDANETTTKAQGLETLDPHLVTPENIIDLGDVVTGKEQGRLSDDEPIIMLSGGLPMEDAAWATRVYRNAKELGVGQSLSLWDSPLLA